MERGNREFHERRIALIVEYNGCNYSGWQIQKNGHSIQGELEKAIAVLTGKEARITGSGRTDAGVHALGQVAHFNCPADIELQRICIGLNGILPCNISVKNAFHVPDDFHSRYWASRRFYRYIIYNSRLRSPFWDGRAMWMRERLDTAYMNKVFKKLKGTHDFTSFCKRRSSEEGTVRTIEKIKATRKGDSVYVEIAGNAFLHNMIRIIIGTVIEMHSKGVEPGYIKKIVEWRDRERAGKTAPAGGLYFMGTRYNPSLRTYSSAFPIGHIEKSIYFNN